jgi:hypothetical protein
MDSKFLIIYIFKNETRHGELLDYVNLCGPFEPWVCREDLHPHQTKIWLFQFTKEIDSEGVNE